MPAYRHGGLYVYETGSPRDAIARELKQIDNRLFLERQVTLDNKLVWCVVCDAGLDQPPITLLEYRDDSGEPISDLSDGVLRRMQRFERDGNKLHNRVLEANRRLQEEKRQQAHDQTRELVLDMVPRITRPRSVVLPRGQYLRRSRDAQRNRGEIV